MRDYTDIVNRAKKKREEEENKNSSFSSYGYDATSIVEKTQLGKKINFDTFESDLQSVGNTINGIYGGWQTQETMANTRNSVVDMQKRIDAYQTYQKKYGGNDLSELAKGYQSVLDDWDNLSSVYGYYENADAYNNALKTAQMDEKFRVKTEDGYLGLTYDEVQEKKKEYGKDSDEYKYLDEYTNYTDLRDFDKALDVLKMQGSGGGQSLAQGLERITGNDVINKDTIKKYNKYKNVLQTARNQYALDHTFDLYKDYMNAEDFEEKSQYETTIDNGRFLGMDDRYIGDEVYEYINNADGEMREHLLAKHYTRISQTQGYALYQPSKFEEMGLDYLTDEEIKVYNYLHKKDKELADKFLSDMEVTLTKRGSDKANDSLKEELDGSVASSVALSLVSPLLNLGGSIYGSVETIGSTLSGEEVNPYSPYYGLSNMSGTIRETVGENISESTEGMELFGQNIPSFLYQTSMSRADSALGVLSFGKALSPVMGMSAYQQKAKELKEAGASEEEIQKGAIASGVFEMAFESVSIDKLLKIKDADSFKNIVKNSLKQAGSEASEEMLTEIANIGWDYLNRGDSSEIMKNYQDYLDRGFTEEEANQKIAMDIVGQVGWAGVGGALSGGAMGGAVSVGNYSDLSATGKQIRANDRVQEMIDLQDLMELQGLTPEQSRAYELYAEYAQKGVNADTISNAQLGNLYQTSLREAEATSESRKATQVQKTDANKRLESLDVIATSKPANERARQQRVASLNKGDVTEVTATGNATTIEGIKIDNGNTIVLTSDGEVKAEDMTFSSKDAELLAYAEDMGEEKGSLLLSQYDGKVDVDTFAHSFELAYSYGESQMGLKKALEKCGNLSIPQVTAIYEAGRYEKVNKRQNQLNAITEKYVAKHFYKGTVDERVIDRTNSGKGEVNWKDLDETQKATIEVINALYTGLGINATWTTKGKEEGFNGYYSREDDAIVLDVYAGIDNLNVKDMNLAIVSTASHELTHWAETKAPTTFAKLKDHVFEALAEKDGLSDADRIENEKNRIKEQMIKNNRKVVEVTDEYAISEIVARSCEDMLAMSDMGKEAFSRLSEKERKTIFTKVKEILQDMIDYISEILGQFKSKSKEAVFLRENQDRLKEQLKLWEQAMKEAIAVNQSLREVGIDIEDAINAVTEKVGVTVDLETESAYPSEQFSERTWTESEYVQNRSKAIEQLSKALGVSKEEAGKYIDDINSVARLIADDRARLDYEPNLDEHATVVKPNSEYTWSVDMSTLCAKRLLFTGTFDEIQRQLPNTALDSDDIVNIRAMMKEAKHEVACGICYVESTRREIGTITNDFIERYKIAQKTGKPISRLNSSGKEVELVEKGTKAKFYAEKGYTPTLAELNTTDIDLVKRDHPAVYGAYLSYMNARGQAKPKLLETRAEYKGEILRHFKAKSAVKTRNDAGGLRLQSFSDFETPHLIDMMQIITDMSRVGLKSQAYTKVANFAEAFGDTGVKINLSLIAKDSGLDADGNLIFDDVEGINHEDAFRIRDKYSKNVGTILVGKNDAHIIRAMADPRIDYIIPFHKSSWKESLYDALGLTGYDDYTASQNEKPIDKTRKIKNFDPSEYWDFSKSGEENAQIYLEKCKEDGRVPKFPQFQGYEGYWKLLIDFKMYDNDGVGSPQTTVTPNFNMEECNRILNEYKGGHRNFPVAKDVVKKFVSEYKKNHPQEQYSDREVRTLTNEDYEQLKSHFGTTANYKVAGYMLKDGAMLDFSGKHWGNPVATSREVDHRDVWDVWENKDFDGTDEMINMISNGNIRLMPETGGINIAVSPTKKQRATLEKYINHFRGEVVVDIDRVGGDTIKSFTYDKGTSAKKILDDIDNYFRGGRQSELMMFHTMYSDRDSEGTQLTEEQIEYFKNSKVRDKDGNLLVMYHGSSDASFTVFDASFSDDKRSFFFTDKLSVSSGYSGSDAVYSPSKAPKNAWELNEYLSDQEDFKVVREEGEYLLIRRDDGHVFFSTSSNEEMFNHILEQWTDEGIHTPKNLKTYLNIVNPLVVDAKGRQWNDIPYPTMNINRYLYIQFRDAGDGKYFAYWSDMANKYEEEESAEMTITEIESKFSKYVADRVRNGDLEFEPIAVNKTTGELVPRNTRQYSYYASENGYDGVIINNVIDMANGTGWGRQEASTVAIAFESNQIKSVANETPTTDADIRYSDREIDSWLYDLSIDDLLELFIDDDTNNSTRKEVEVKKERSKRRVDEVNKRLKQIGLSFNGTKSLAWTDERIDKYLSGGYYGSSNPNYAQAYIGYITPQQFLNLTVGGKNITLDVILNESESYGDVDFEKLGNSTPIFLEIKEEKNGAKVTGHEGRHRMYLLGKAGFERIPVLFFDYRTKYDKTFKSEMKLTAQRYNDTDLISKSRNVVAEDLIPFSQGNRDLIVERFGSGNKEADIRYSDRDSDGNHISEGQQEYFRDSKVRDENGNLLVMYHGTPNGDFNVFDRNKIGSTTDSGWFGKGFYFTSKENLAKRYARYLKSSNVKKVYLNVVNPFVIDYKVSSENVFETLEYITGTYADSFSEMSRIFTNWLIENGYDGVIYKRNNEVMVLNSNQIKNVDNYNPTDDEDIRFSDRDNVSVYDAMGETDRLIEENQRIKEDVETLKRTISSDEVNIKRFRSLADYLKKLAGSQYDRETLGDELNELYTYIQTTDDLQWNNVMAKAYDTARRMMNLNPNVSMNYFRQVMADIRKDKVTLSAEQRAEAEKLFGSYGDFHKAMFGRVNIVTGGTPLEQMWKEWSQKYPAIFKSDLGAVEQVEAIVDITNALKATSSMMGEYEREEAIRHLATEIYNQFWNVASDSSDAVRGAKASHRKLMEDLRKEYEQRQKEKTLHPVGETALKYEKLLRKVMQKDKAEIKKAKELGKKRLDEFKDRTERNAKIKSITAKALTLNQWLTKNSKDEHIPEVMKAPVAYLLNAIDFSSKQLLGMRGGSNAGIATKKDISLSKALEQVHDMVQKINSAQIGEDEITEIYGTFADFPAGFADDIRKLSGTVNNVMRTVGDNAYVLNQMSLEELETLDRIVGIIKATVTKMNKFLAIRHAEGVANLSQQSINYMDSLGKGKTHEGIRGKVDKMLDWGNALPYYTFKRFGEGGQKVYEALQDGWDTFAFHVKEIIDYTDSVYTSKEVKEWSETVNEFDILEPATDEEKASADYEPKYQKVKMSVPQIMSLYCLQKREQAKSHLMGGGMRISDIKTKKNIIPQSEGVILAQSEIDMIVETLTDRQREVADALQEFMNTTCTDWGNEVSMLRFGFKAFGEENYFPIKSDDNNLTTNDETERNNSLFRLLNMSFTKGTIKNANNRIVISDIFDVFAQHTSDMAKYNALALPVLDSFKWYNYKEKIKKGETAFITKSLKQSMENAFSKDAQNYFVTFLRDINGEQSAGRDVVGGGFFTNAKLASVVFNMRVVALQPTSYVRASAVIDNKYLTKAFIHKPKIAMAEKHCGIALWKSLGFYDINIQSSVTDMIKGSQTVKDKIVNFSMKGAEIADKVTWGYLWNACELEIRDKRKDLRVGSKEFYEAIGKRLREIIYSTQVVDSTMTRSHMMRSPDGKDKMLTAFMSEPTLAYNMLQDCYFDWKLTERQTGSKQTAFKKHGKKIARVITAYTVTNMLCALVESGFDIFRDDEDEVTAEEFIKLYLKNLASDMSILNKIPYAKEAVSMLQGYSSSRTDTQWMQYMTYTITGIGKLLEGEGNVYTTAKNAMRAFSQMTGLPIYNAWRDTTALLDKTELLSAEELEEIFNDTIGSIFPSLKSK